MIGQTLDGRYQVVRPLGSGGFGQTYIAKDTRRPGEPSCVVKMLQPASSNPQFLEVARRLFRNEAETLEKVGHHDQIPRLLAFFEQDQDFYLVQELVEGKPLTDELISGTPWSEFQVRLLISEILELLVFIHNQGVIHRDIKPDNIIRRRADQKLVLVDFGSVKQVRNQALVADQPTSVTVVVGTPGYMSSEQSQGKPRASSDLYSVGIIGIQAITGIVPAQFQEDIDGELVWTEQAKVSQDFAQFLSKMVRPYFKLRYQTAAEALKALSSKKKAINTKPPKPPTPQRGMTAKVSSGLPTQVVGPPPIVPSPRKQPDGCGAWAAGLGAMIVVLGLGLVGLTYFGVTEELFPALNPDIVSVDNGDTLLEEARQKARSSGNLEDAIAIAKQVSSSSSSAQEAQTQVQQWQTQWQKQNDIFRRAKAAFEKKRWYTARDLAFLLPQNSHWDNLADPIYFGSKRKIAALEKPSPIPTPQITEPPEPTLEPTPSPSPEPPPSETDEPTPSPSPTPLQLPVLVPVPTPTPQNPPATPSPPVTPATTPRIPNPN